jgi:hypothetical protein
MSATRRDVMRLCGVAALSASCGKRAERQRVVVASAEPVAAAAIEDGVLDEVLEALHAREPWSNHGLSTHAPMVAEALCALGAADRVRAWLSSYGGERVAIPEPHRPIVAASWREALGPDRDASSYEAELHRWGDWREFFAGELAGARWQDAVDRWVGRLAPGISAAATHGVIRTAHAVRALSRRDTPPRRAELARGLALWAAAYEELPAGDATGAAPDVGTALAGVALYTEQRGRAPGGNIVSGLRAVAALAPARDLVAPSNDLDADLSSLTAAFARVYLQHGTRSHAVAFVHAITAPCALRRIAPHVAPATARAAFPYAWQAAAAIYAAYAQRDHAARPIEPTLAPSALVTRAIDNGNDHAIKLTEAVLAEHALRPDAAYLAAAEDAVTRL